MKKIIGVFCTATIIASLAFPVYALKSIGDIHSFAETNLSVEVTDLDLAEKKIKIFEVEKGDYPEIDSIVDYFSESDTEALNVKELLEKLDLDVPDELTIQSDNRKIDLTETEPITALISVAYEDKEKLPNGYIKVKGLCSEAVKGLTVDEFVAIQFEFDNEQEKLIGIKAIAIQEEDFQSETGTFSLELDNSGPFFLARI